VNSPYLLAVPRGHLGWPSSSRSGSAPPRTSPCSSRTRWPSRRPSWRRPRPRLS